MEACPAPRHTFCESALLVPQQRAAPWWEACVTPSRRELRASLSADDMGCSMPQADLAGAFAPFFTTRPLVKGRVSDSAWCTALTISQAGTSHVASTQKAGTLLTLYLLRAESETASDPHQATREPSMHTRATVCVKLGLLILLLVYRVTPASGEDTVSVRIATFNVSMEAGNYLPQGAVPGGRELPERLVDGSHPQIRGIAEILQRVRPDIVLLNEFDHFEQPEAAVLPFLHRYLARGQNGQQPLAYPYFYTAPVNTGFPSGHDLNRDGRIDDSGQDAFGYGLYPGQYGMLILSRYPLLADSARTFRHFLWRDMPDNLMQSMHTPEGEPWYDETVQGIFRLSSKSHWDVAADIDGRRLHLLASHPTPPGFDGPEDRNGRRNHDEVRFWVDYISGGEQAGYIVDDADGRGGLRGGRFVILGDLNASPVEGDARPAAIRSLVAHSKVNDDAPPTSAAGAAASPGNRHAGSHTASWGLRADYVLPSRAGWSVTDSGVYWPGPGEPARALVESRAASSDHRLVWVDLVLEPLPE